MQPEATFVLKEQPQRSGRFLMVLIALEQTQAWVEVIGETRRFSEFFLGCSGRGRLSLALKP
jgi:hypothetical protein